MKFDRRISFLKKSWKKINNRFSSIQIIVFYYLAMTVLSLILFSLPFFVNPVLTCLFGYAFHGDFNHIGHRVNDL